MWPRSPFYSSLVHQLARYFIACRIIDHGFEHLFGLYRRYGHGKGNSGTHKLLVEAMAPVIEIRMQ